MRRSNEKSKVSVYNTGKGITGQALLYQHMSNHYRRILNAKKSIDTAPPIAFREKRNGSSSRNDKNGKSACSLPGDGRKKSGSRNTSPALTERTASICSNGGSYWGGGSYYGRKCGSYPRNSRCTCQNTVEANPNASDMELINRIAFDTKTRPTDCLWKNAQERENLSEFRSPYQAKQKNLNSRSSITSAGCSKKTNPTKHKFTTFRKVPQKDKQRSDLMEKHSTLFISHSNSFCPRILKTNASSKVRGLKVYHPPRKKKGKQRGTEWTEDIKAPMEPVDVIKSKTAAISDPRQKRGIESTCKCKELSNPREASQTSSRDSAYNGGISSLPESRSPTPDQRKQKTSCSCHKKGIESYYQEDVKTERDNIVVPNLKLTETQDTQTETIESCERKRDDQPEISRSTHLVSKSTQSNGTGVNCSTVKNSNEEENDYLKRKIKEETLYTSFVRDITAEVLEKGLYTNKALRRVMKRHVVKNLWLLDKEKMLKEVEKLRIQLGIPDDDDLIDVKTLETSGSMADIEESYSIISDSELTDSGPTCRGKARLEPRRRSVTSDTFKRTHFSEASTHAVGAQSSFPKSISDVIQMNESNQIIVDSESDEEDELISVIHVTKLIRDNKKKSSSNELHGKTMSSDPSRNGTRGNSADESEQSSDHVSRKKKALTRYRRLEKTSSSSDDGADVANISSSDNRASPHGRHYTGNLRFESTGRITFTPKKLGANLCSCDFDDSEVGSSKVGGQQDAAKSTD